MKVWFVCVDLAAVQSCLCVCATWQLNRCDSFHLEISMPNLAVSFYLYLFNKWSILINSCVQYTLVVVGRASWRDAFNTDRSMYKTWLTGIKSSLFGDCDMHSTAASPASSVALCPHVLSARWIIYAKHPPPPSLHPQLKILYIGG